MAFSLLLCDDDPQMFAIILNILDEKKYFTFNLDYEEISKRLERLGKQKSLTLLDVYQVVADYNSFDENGKLTNPYMSGMYFDIAAEQDKAIEKIRKNDYDLIITDCDFSAHGTGDPAGGVAIIEEAFKKKRTGIRLYSALPPPLVGDYKSYSKYKEAIDRLGTGEIYISKNSDPLLIEKNLVDAINEVRDYNLTRQLTTAGKINFLKIIKETLSLIKDFHKNALNYFNLYMDELKKGILRITSELQTLLQIKEDIKYRLDEIFSFSFSPQIDFSSIFIKETIVLKEFYTLIIGLEQTQIKWLENFAAIMDNFFAYIEKTEEVLNLICEEIEKGFHGELPYINTQERTRTKKSRESYDKEESVTEYISSFIVKLDEIFDPPLFATVIDRENWEKELLEEQTRLISSLWTPYGSRAIELRILRKEKDRDIKEDYLEIYLLGRVNHPKYTTSIEIARELWWDLEGFINRTEKKYKFSPVKTEKEFREHLGPFDFNYIKDIGKTVEIIDIDDLKAYLIYPFKKSLSKNKLFEILLSHRQNLLYSVALTPVQLNYWEETDLCNIYDGIKNLEKEYENRENLNIKAKGLSNVVKNRIPLIQSTLNYQMTKFKKAFLMKIQVASPVPLKNALLNELGYELTLGDTEDFQIKMPACKEEEKICKDNLTFCEFTHWGENRLPENLIRLQYMISHDEAISAFSFPLPKEEGVSGVRMAAHKVKSSIPENLPEEGGIIGEVECEKEKKIVRITAQDQRQHIYIVGKTGSGKSTMLKSLIMSRIREGAGVCLIDPHGDLCDYFLTGIPRERAEDAILLDASDTAYPVALNMLDAKTKEDREFLIQEFINIIRKLYLEKDYIGPVFEERVRLAVELLYLHPIAATIPDINKVFLDKDFRDYLLDEVKDADLSRNIIASIDKIGGTDWGKDVGPYTTSKFAHYTRDSIIKNITGQPDFRVNIREVMENNKILLVKLPKGEIGELNCSILGMLILSRIHLATMERAAISEEKRKDFYCFIDEFQTFTTTRLIDILSEARKYRLNMTLAHQHITQLEHQIKDAVLGNVGSIISFRLGSLDAYLMEDYFLPVINKINLINLPYWNAVCRILIDGQPTEPFMVKTVLDDIRPDEKIKERIIKNSRKKYARPEEQVVRIREHIEKIREYAGKLNFSSRKSREGYLKMLLK